MELLDKYEDLLTIRKVSSKTMITYLRIAKSLIDYDKTFFEGEQSVIIKYLSNRVKQGISASYLIQYIAVIDFIRGNILDIHDRIKIEKPEKEVIVPDVLTTDEFQILYSSVHNIKHKAILALMYSSGMRVGEVVNLKMKDVDGSNSKIIIRQSKGKVDRVVILDDSILSLLREYFIAYQPNIYLFNGSTGGKYSTRSIQAIVKNSCRKAGITKNISTHSLRHSCFTQLIKNGVDLRTIQRLAGHKNINTTAGYIRISDEDVLSVKSPIKGIKI